MRNKKLVLTGATGFIGRYCIPLLLQRGYEVHCLNRTADRAISDVHWHQVDLFDEKRTSGIIESVEASYLMHIAWITTPGTFWESSDNHKWLTATRNLFNTFASSRGERLLGVGSCAEYEWGSSVYQEKRTPIKPATLYGRTKVDASNALERISSGRGASWVWARIFFIYGPGEPREKLIPSVVSALHERHPIDTTDGLQIRDYVYVEDVARALCDLLGSSQRGYFNIGSGAPVRVRELLQELCEIMHSPADLVRFGKLSPRPSEPDSIVADISRLKTALSWEPKVTLSQGLRREVSRIIGEITESSKL